MINMGLIDTGGFYCSCEGEKFAYHVKIIEHFSLISF